mgnify:FL=1
MQCVGYQVWLVYIYIILFLIDMVGRKAEYVSYDKFIVSYNIRLS